MIKIIKPGKVMIAKCPTCECEFSYEKEDIQFGNQRDYYEEIVCPCCKNYVDVSHCVRG